MSCENTKTLISYYKNCHEIHTKKYGEKTAVIMQVGSFYEMYSTRDEERGSGPDLKKISIILNVILTKKNKSIEDVTEENPYMLGFPIVSEYRYINVLLTNGYTVIIYEQQKKNGKIDRILKKILSPGTALFHNELDMIDNDKYLTTIYITNEKQFDKTNVLCVGMSIINLIEGKVNHIEMNSKEINDRGNNNDIYYCYDEISRILSIYPTKELIILIDKMMDDRGFNKEEFMNYIGIDEKISVHKYKMDEKYKNIRNQNIILEEIYGKHMINIFEYLSLIDNQYSRIAITYSLEYIKSHDNDLIKKIGQPKYIDGTGNMILGNNAIQQLNIITNINEKYGKINSLFDVIDNTSTIMGKRFLRSKIVSPMIKIEDIKRYQDKTEKIIEEKIEKNLMNKLCQFTDIQKILRRLTTNYGTFNNIYEIYNNLILFINFVESNKKYEFMKLINDNEMNHTTKIINIIESTFDIEKIKKMTNDDLYYDTIFKQNTYNEIDEIIMEITKTNTIVNDIKNYLNNILEEKITIKKTKTTKDHIMIEQGNIFVLSKRKGMLIEELIENNKIDKKYMSILKKYVINKKTSSWKFVFDELDEKKFDLRQKKLYEIQIKHIQHFINSLFNDDVIFLIQKITSKIIEIDYVNSNAITAIKNNYSKPLLIDDKTSYINVKELRHPIIEKIISHSYITHDINLGYSNNTENIIDGILLYGMNCSGKTSISKAIAISVIMAQCGMYVPAKNYILSPFNSIFTRITGNDNMFRGLSSFAVELVELNTIFKRVDHKTLVIGDEICRGTENKSANIIVTATILKLINSKCKFIFATHLHEIQKYDDIQNIKNLKSMHLSVSYDHINDSVVFDRILKNGPGDDFYGILVAKYNIKDEYFLNHLLKFTNDFKSSKSRYNPNIYSDKCEICGIQNKTLHTHHIIYQMNFKNNNFSNIKGKEHIEKNHISNLIMICESCHLKVHHDKIQIENPILTTNGKNYNIIINSN